MLEEPLVYVKTESLKIDYKLIIHSFFISYNFFMSHIYTPDSKSKLQNSDLSSKLRLYNQKFFQFFQKVEHLNAKQLRNSWQKKLVCLTEQLQNKDMTYAWKVLVIEIYRQFRRKNARVLSVTSCTANVGSFTDEELLVRAFTNI